MASGSLSASSLVHSFASGSASSVVETSSSGSSSATPPPSGLLESSANHPLLSHHLVMKNERLHHQHQHRLYQPYNHLPLHHHHHHHLQQQHHLLENHYDLGQHYPVASTSNASIIGGGTESRCSSVSSSGADHHTLTLKSEQPQSSSLETSSLELLENANVSRFLKNFNTIYFVNPRVELTGSLLHSCPTARILNAIRRRLAIISIFIITVPRQRLLHRLWEITIIITTIVATVTTTTTNLPVRRGRRR